MEGHRLILKRRVRKGQRLLTAAFLGGGVLMVPALFVQMQLTLSQRTLAAVRADAGRVKDSFVREANEGEVAGATIVEDDEESPAETVAQLKVLLEAALKARADAEAAVKNQVENTEITSIPTPTVNIGSTETSTPTTPSP